MAAGSLRRAAPALLLVLALGSACGAEGEGKAGGGDAPRVETGGAGTLDGNDVVDANVTTDTQTVPMPDSVAGS